jgi:hypothetical protein
MSAKTKIRDYFNPEQHLAFHQDKDGNMIGGGYQVNNLLYKHKMPLFVSLDDAEGGMTGGGGGNGSGGGNGGTDHFIPEKFSDLFRDLAVPAGLFMMPALFRPRQYATSVVAEEDVTGSSPRSGNHDSESDDSDDSDDDSTRRKPVPDDIFDTLLSLVTPSERIQHDVKTRRYKGSRGGKGGSKKSQNKTRRGKME